MVTVLPDAPPDLIEWSRPSVVLGTVTTRLLNTSEALPLDAARQALALLPGVSADWRGHPIERVVSPDLFFGVDCRLATRTGSRPRAVGTVRARAVLTAGHVLQGSANVAVLLDASNRRMPWAHYMARTGTAEVIHKADPADLATSFLHTKPAGAMLDLAQTGSHVMALVSRVPQIDRQSRLKTETSRLFWAAHLQPDADPEAQVEAGGDGVFRIRISTPPALLPQFAEFCEVLALHDWLLSSLKNAFDRATRRGRRPEDEIDSALTYLGHLWNPTGHLPPETRWLWRALEDEAQLTWQWQSTLTRARDKVSVLMRKAIEETLNQQAV